MSDDLSGLTLPELYDRLVPTEAPAPISMWPQTAGWLWLGAAVLLLLAFAIWRWVAWRRSTAYRRAALTSLRAVGQDPAAIANVLKRTALAGFPRDEVAGLYGAGWLAFLDRAGKGRKFTGSEAGQVLATAPYAQQKPNADLAAMAEEWIKTHKNESQHS